MSQVLVPYLSYRDAAAAIEWLADAFGFEKAQAFRGPDGEIMHAELRLGDATVMLGSGDSPGAGAEPLSEQSPRGHGIYVIVEDVEAHFEQAKAAGAEIVYEPEDTEFGTRRCRLLDLEGYEWSFGTYAPGIEGAKVAARPYS